MHFYVGYISFKEQFIVRLEDFILSSKTESLQNPALEGAPREG